VRCATARDCRLARVLIRDVMTESVVTAAPERTVREIAELMRERNVGSVVLVDGSAPVGFVTDRDLALSVIADGRDFGDHVADHASSPVITAEASMDVEEAGELMVRHAIRR
jgi:CBS domain-containing protein